MSMNHQCGVRFTPEGVGALSQYFYGGLFPRVMSNLRTAGRTETRAAELGLVDMIYLRRG